MLELLYSPNISALVNAVNIGSHGKEHRVLPVATLLDGVEILLLLVGFCFKFGHFLSLGFNGIIKCLGTVCLGSDVKVEDGCKYLRPRRAKLALEAFSCMNSDGLKKAIITCNEKRRADAE